jgi:peroxin-16
MHAKHNNRLAGLVSNLDWLLYLGVYGPGRQAQEDAGSEWRYEAYHAAIGLLSVWHNHILDEDDQGRSCRPPLALWLDLLEQARYGIGTG